MKLAAETGAVVMLDGQGGDEVILGYERYYSNYLNDVNPVKMLNKVFRFL